MSFAITAGVAVATAAAATAGTSIYGAVNSPSQPQQIVPATTAQNLTTSENQISNWNNQIAQLQLQNANPKTSSSQVASNQAQITKLQSQVGNSQLALGAQTNQLEQEGGTVSSSLASTLSALGVEVPTQLNPGTNTASIQPATGTVNTLSPNFSAPATTGISSTTLLVIGGIVLALIYFFFIRKK